MSEYLKKIAGFGTYTELHDKLELQEGSRQFGNVRIFIGPEGERVTFGVQVTFLSPKTGETSTIFTASSSKELTTWKVIGVLQNILSGNFEYTDKYDKKVTGRLQKDIEGTTNLLNVYYNDNDSLVKSFVNDFIKENFKVC